MRPQLLKQPTVRLHGEPYRELHERVLRRDGWRCQMCGSANNLTVHHQQYRSRSGEDREENLITLCSECHSAAHRKED
jgi:5-methylcytosine-specific restriction endonuclease McrA